MSTAHAHGFDASFYPTTVTRDVPGLGESRLDCLRMDEAMRLYAAPRPLRLDYRRWTSDFVAATLGEPRLSPRDVEGLSDLAREALRTATAEANGCGEAYRELTGSHLSRDERLFAAYHSTMGEHFASLRAMGTEFAANAATRLVRAATPVVRTLVVASADGLAQVTQSLARVATRSLTHSLAQSRPALWVPRPGAPIASRSLEASLAPLLNRRLDSVGRLIAVNRQQLHGGLMLYEGLRALLHYSERYERLWEIREKLDAWSEGPFAYLTEPLRPGLVLEVIGLVEEAGEMALLDLLERAVRDEEVMARLRATIIQLPLSTSKRVRLNHALGHVLKGEFELAIDALIAVVEGLFWNAASERGLIDERDRFTAASGRGGPATAVEKLFPPLGLTGAFRELLVRRAYGGRGHPFRHGRAETGERDQVLFLVLALVGWLEIFAGVPARSWLSGALERELTVGSLVGAALTALDARAARAVISGRASNLRPDR